MSKAALFLLLLLAQYHPGRAQAGRDTMRVSPVPAQDTVPPEIQVSGNEDSLHFSALLRPLRRVAGAPASFYTYFWELGDGSFSFSPRPVHTYHDTGTYEVRLYATNNYDDGKAPPTRPRPVKINRKPVRGASWASGFFKGGGNIEMKINRNPKPGEAFVALVGYRNPTADSLGGSVALFFNERQFGQEGFALEEKRYYHGEDSTTMHELLAQLSLGERQGERLLAGPHPPGYTGYAEDTRSLLQSLQGNYTKHTVLRFKNTAPGNERFLFMTMNTLPGMIADTNATVTMSALLVPDNPALPPELFELEMQVVASHDPNRLQLRQRHINYRFMGKRKELTYKVRFQNTGKGPASKVAIGISLPRQLNTQSVTVKNMRPYCTWCDSAYNRQSCIDTVRTGDSIYFVFKNIYLPGMQQEGITDEDSTKGFVEYTIRFRKKPKKIPFSSRAAIVFDKNEPVYTNKATGRFVKGISPGIMAGYGFSPSHALSKLQGPVQIGFLLAPYAPSRPYFQVEAHAGFWEKETTSTGFIQTKRDTVLNGQLFFVAGRERTTTLQRHLLQVVPLHYRYNLNSWVGIGIGAQVQLSMEEQTTVTDKIYLANIQQPAIITGASSASDKQAGRWFGSWNAAPFADLQVGRVKSGPAIGLRYLYALKGEEASRFLVYGVFRL